ncbi:hypothetical protein LOC67_05140 [Stieleria sp. JC731]|uniref:hypothetical protein n=1 Tax=Pirellulaceae TaxID=2691357 RepID=UPI001E35D311|nr:hypothetical protein [Stieleria sp. JC731]MCC9599937.1 hypothetical protein [Stieleria sp. JC731]
MTDRNSKPRFPRYRYLLAWMWCISSLAVAAYALLKPSTTAADLVGIPDPWVQWLDENYNLRTYVMAVLICVGPASLLAHYQCTIIRRSILAIVLTVLLVLEFCQLAIPSRGFSWPDVYYTIAGVITCELFAVGMLLFWQSSVLDHLLFGSDRASARHKQFFAWACLVLIVLQFGFVFASNYLPPVTQAVLPTWLADWLGR